MGYGSDWERNCSNFNHPISRIIDPEIIEKRFRLVDVTITLTDRYYYCKHFDSSASSGAAVTMTRSCGFRNAEELSQMQARLQFFCIFQKVKPTPAIARMAGKMMEKSGSSS